MIQSLNKKLNRSVLNQLSKNKVNWSKQYIYWFQLLSQIWLEIDINIYSKLKSMKKEYNNGHWVDWQ